MRRPTILAPVLAVILLATTALTASPVSALSDRASIALGTRYLLRANLSFAAGTISAKERIVIKNKSGGPISKVNLSVTPRAFGELTSIGGFSVDGRTVTARWTNNSNLELQLGRDLAVGSTAVIRLRFAVRASGVIGTSLEGRLSKANGIMQVGHWFPIVSDGHATRYPGDAQHTRAASKIRLELTTDSSAVRIAAPGTPVYSSGRYHVYELTNARDFAFGASPNYQVATGIAAGVHIRAYYTTGSGATAVASAMAALTRYEAVYGQFGWTRFVIAQTGRPGSGNEYPGLIFLGGRLLGIREVVAHETAHQWWYGMAGNDQMREPWLDEALAEFSASHFFGQLESFASARPVNSRVHDFPNVPAPLTSDDPGSYDQTVYFKGAAFLETLRAEMGSEAFFAGLRDLFEANRNGTITTREFIRTMTDHGAATTTMRAFLSF
ncbi:MAG TPA: M1 family aminopeptidase [Candidatus Limnocylindrales bacterium]